MPRLIGELSSDEAIELAAQVAELARAGLPLSGGLRALAEEVGGGRLTRVLGSMADQLDEGATLGEVILAHHDVLPLHIRGLLTAAIKSGRLPEAMHEFVDIQRKRAELRRRVWLASAVTTTAADTHSVPVHTGSAGASGVRRVGVGSRRRAMVGARPGGRSR